MDKSKIEKSIEDFRKEVQVLFKEGSKEPATIGDMYELARATYYVFNDMLQNLD